MEKSRKNIQVNLDQIYYSSEQLLPLELGFLL